MKWILIVLFYFSSAWAAKFTNANDFFVQGNFKNEDAKFEALMKHHWNYNMQEFPEWATFVGIPGHNDQWTDESMEAIARRDKASIYLMNSLKKSIDYKKLSGKNKVNYDLLRQSYQENIDGQKFDGEYLVLNHLDGIHTGIADTLMANPKNNKQDIQDMLKRLDSAASRIDQNMALMKEGLKRGVTAPQVILQKVPSQFDTIIPKDPKESAMYMPFQELPASMADAEKSEVQQKALEILKTKLYPKLTELKKFIVEEYIPGARKTLAVTALPNGDAWYKYAVRVQTTTTMNPEEIHQLGLSEVARIEKEMLKIKDQVGFKGSLQDFNKYLLSDKKFQYDNAKDLMAGYREVAKRADAELPKLFGNLPRLSYGVREMPAYKAPSSPAAYYMGGSLEAGRAGYFEANTYKPESRPKWGMEALTLHEAVPGHHLQISLAQEMGDLPEFRKFGGYNAYSEGWGLYAESLGDQMQMYQDPYSSYGRYTYEMWRAVRLVVDTGVHAKGWTRDQALKYFGDHLAKSANETEVEVDRYIVWPGQALAYKIGQLKFQQLRANAQKELKDRFDIRRFHDEVLRHGSIPLNALEKLFTQWLEKEKKGNLKVKKN